MLPMACAFARRFAMALLVQEAGYGIPGGITTLFAVTAGMGATRGRGDDSRADRDSVGGIGERLSCGFSYAFVSEARHEKFEASV